MSSRWELPEVRHEQAFHLRDFCGRAELIAAVDAWIEGTAEGGFLLLSGGPGVGKSALAAAIAERRGAVLHMVKSHPGPARLLRALVAQAAERGGFTLSEGELGGDVHDLRNVFVRALEALVAARGAAVVVLDGLDELDGAPQLDALPAHAPSGVRFVLTSRPRHDVARALRARVGALHELAVPPLSSHDVGLLVARREGRLDAARIHARTGGLPLLVRRALDALTQGGDAPDYDALPATLEDLFDEVHRAIAAGGAERVQLLHAITCAREALDARQLAEVVGLTPGACRDHLAAMSAYLIELRPGAFLPWHRGLADFVHGAVLGEAGRRAVEARFAAWAAPGAASDYALRHGTSHLVAAGRGEEACAALADDAYLGRKVAAGLVFDLVTELDHLLGPTADARAIRRHAHFLSRHPAALPTVLGRAVPSEAPWLRRIAPPTEAPAFPEVFALRGHGAEVFDVDVSPDGARAASASADGTVRLWEVGSGRELAVIAASARRALSVAFSTDGGRVLVGTDGEGLRSWSLDGVEGPRRADGQAVWAVAVSPCGRWTAAGTRAGEVWLWDGTERVAARWVVGGVITSVAFSATPGRLTAGSTFQRLWRGVFATDDGAPLETRTIDVPSTPWTVAFQPRVGAVLAACADGVVRVWSELAEQLVEHVVGDDRLYAMALSEDGSSALVGGARGTLARIDLEGAGRVVRSAAHDDAVDAVVLSRDPAGGAPLLVTASADGTVRGFRPPEGSAPEEREPGRVTAAAFSPDAETLAVGAFDGMLTLVRSATGATSASRRLHASRIHAVAFSDDGAWVATASQDGTARVVRALRLGGSVVVAAGHEAAVTAVAFSPPGRFVTGSSDQTVRLWALFGGREARRWALDDAIASVASDAVGAHVAAITRSGTLRVMRVDDGAIVGEASLAAAPQRVTFAGDGLRVDLRDGSWRAFALAPLREVLGPEREPFAPACAWARAESAPETLLRDAAGEVRAAYPRPLETCCASAGGSVLAGWVEDDLHLLHLEPPPRPAR